MTSVAIAGGHGQIALRLARLLSARGDSVRSIIRNPGHEAGVHAAGAEPVVADMEALDDLAAYVDGCDAVVFAAGAGPGSGAERKRTVDFGAAVKLRDAALAVGARRYLMVSSIGSSDPAASSEAMRPYHQAKADADAAVAESALEWTIVRPGRLTDDAGTGLVAAAARLDPGEITRDDVAAVLAACLDTPSTIGKAFDLVQGETPIATALAAL